LKEAEPEWPYLFAKGISCEESEDAEILFNFDFEELKSFSEGKTHKSDPAFYKKFIVKKGLLIAKKIPLKDGTPGTDVFGREIFPKKPKDKNLSIYQGENTAIDSSSFKLVSLAEGILKFASHGSEKLTVDSVLIITGDIDAGTGNVEFEGSVFVEGMVKPGFLIKARDDIKVSDIVEAATLIAGQGIEISGGVKGRGKAFLSAGRDIKLKFCENAELDAGRDLIIESAAVNSILKSKRDIFFSGPQGEIVGGSTSSGRMVEASEIGSSMNLKTTIEVGVDPGLREKLIFIRSQIAVDKENQQKLSMIVKKLRELRIAMKDQFQKDKLELLVKSINTLNTLNVELPNLEKELREIELKLEMNVQGAKIVASKVMHPGTEVTIRDRKFYVTQELTKVILVLENGEIRVGGYR